MTKTGNAERTVALQSKIKQRKRHVAQKSSVPLHLPPKKQTRVCCKIDDSKRHAQKEDAFTGQLPPKSVFSLILSCFHCSNCYGISILHPHHDRSNSARLDAFLLCRPLCLRRVPAASLQPRRLVLFQNHLVISGGSCCNLTMTAAIPSGSPPFCSAGHCVCSAFLPPAVNPDGRFSFFRERKKKSAEKRKKA